MLFTGMLLLLRRPIGLRKEPAVVWDVPRSVIGTLEQFPAKRLGSGTRWEAPMPNEPRPAAEKRTPPLDRRNAQGDHEGSPHRPEEFKTETPARQVTPGENKGED